MSVSKQVILLAMLFSTCGFQLSRADLDEIRAEESVEKFERFLEVLREYVTPGEYFTRETMWMEWAKAFDDKQADTDNRVLQESYSEITEKNNAYFKRMRDEVKGEKVQSFLLRVKERAPEIYAWFADVIAPGLGVDLDTVVWLLLNSEMLHNAFDDVFHAGFNAPLNEAIEEILWKERLGGYWRSDEYRKFLEIAQESFNFNEGMFEMQDWQKAISAQQVDPDNVVLQESYREITRKIVACIKLITKCIKNGDKQLFSLRVKEELPRLYAWIKDVEMPINGLDDIGLVIVPHLIFPC